MSAASAAHKSSDDNDNNVFKHTNTKVIKQDNALAHSKDPAIL